MQLSAADSLNNSQTLTSPSTTAHTDETTTTTTTTTTTVGGAITDQTSTSSSQTVVGPTYATISAPGGGLSGSGTSNSGGDSGSTLTVPWMPGQIFQFQATDLARPGQRPRPGGRHAGFLRLHLRRRERRECRPEVPVLRRHSDHQGGVPESRHRRPDAHQSRQSGGSAVRTRHGRQRRGAAGERRLLAALLGLHAEPQRHARQPVGALRAAGNDLDRRQRRDAEVLHGRVHRQLRHRLSDPDGLQRRHLHGFVPARRQPAYRPRDLLPGDCRHRRGQRDLRRHRPVPGLRARQGRHHEERKPRSPRFVGSRQQRLVGPRPSSSRSQHDDAHAGHRVRPDRSQCSRRPPTTR